MDNKNRAAERKKGGRPSKSNKPDAAMLLAMYAEHTSGELAELYDVPASTIRAWVCRARKEAAKDGR